MTLQTVWRISAIEAGATGPTLRGLKLELVVNTTAPQVIKTIERAMQRASVQFELVEPPEDDA